MKIMVISPHPDDETLGAGGTLLRYKSEGHQIYWLNITNVEENGRWSKSFVEKRQRQIIAICEFYCFDKFIDLKYEPTGLDSVNRNELIEKIGKYFDEFQPEWLILPDGNDAHSDHKVVYECCMACSKVFRHPYIKRVTTMEILSETDFGKPDNPFVPNMFVDISDYIDKKLEALAIYDTEIRERPFPRNMDAVKALGTLRGGMAGCMYAEAFKIIKEIQ